MKTYPKLEKRAKLVLAELNVIPKIVRGCGLITLKTMKLNINICGTSDGDFLWVNIFDVYSREFLGRKLSVNEAIKILK